MQKNPLVITASIAALIVVTALAVLAVLSAFEGQKSGQDMSSRVHCPKISAKAVQDVTDPGYGTRLAKLAHCR